MSQDLGTRTEHLRLEVDGWAVVDATECGEYSTTPNRIWIGMDAQHGRWVTRADAGRLIAAIEQVLASQASRVAS